MDTSLVEQVRSFNRIMTERIGVLNDHFLGRNHPLGEARLLQVGGLFVIKENHVDIRASSHASLWHPVTAPAK